jgi:hypothetical protein
VAIGLVERLAKQGTEEVRLWIAVLVSSAMANSGWSVKQLIKERMTNLRGRETAADENRGLAGSVAASDLRGLDPRQRTKR